MSTLYSISSDTLTGLADAVRELTGTSAPLSPDDMIDGIEGHVCPSPTINPLSVTQNGEYTAPSGVDGYSPITVNVSGGGGGGIGDLLATQSLGHITVSSTSAINLNKTVTVTGINDYDLLIVITAIDDPTAMTGLHSTTVAIGLSSGSSLSTKSSAAVGSLKQNLISNFNKTIVKIVASTSAFGIYPYSATISNGVASLAMYGRYSGTNTENINGDYTTRVYGIKLYQDYY